MEETNLLDKIIAEYNGDFARLEKDLASKKAQQKKSPKSLREKGDVLVSLRGVSRIYKKGKNTVTAAQDITLNIHQGEIVALIGPSGSGKSTVLNLISGLDTPTEGDVEISGTLVNKLRPNERAYFRSKNVGFVFQFFYLQPFLNLLTNVEVPAMFSGLGKDERRTQAQKLIDAVGLGDRALHLPKELSGGQMQRAAIARALLNNPKLLLADEPTGNLDSKNAQDVLDLFEQVRDEYGTTIIVVTHDPKIAERADYSIEMMDGKVVS